MIVKEFEIKNEYGLHARPASLFCNAASKFVSDVIVKRNGNDMEADGKSVISVLMLEVYPGSTIKVKVTGEDEEGAILAITKLIDNNFEE